MTSRGRERAAGSHLAQALCANRYCLATPALRGPIEKMTTETIHSLSAPFTPLQWGYLLHHHFPPRTSYCLPRSRGPAPGSKAPLHTADPQTCISGTSSLQRVRPISANSCPTDASHSDMQSRTACLLHTQISPHPRELLSAWSATCPTPCPPLTGSTDSDGDFSSQPARCWCCIPSGLPGKNPGFVLWAGPLPVPLAIRVSEWLPSRC